MSGDEPFGLGGIDTSRPSVARIYDYWLGGSNNFAPDRELAAAIVRIDPDIEERALLNRAFVTGAARRAATAGISQFIDVGAGLPTHPSIHEAAREVRPGAAVVYVDHDREVVCHATAMLATGDGVTATEGDVSDPPAVLGSDAVRSAIDLAQPCAVMIGAVLQFFTVEESAAIVAGFAEAIAPRSWVIVSVVHYTVPALETAVRASYTARPLFNHSAEDMKQILAPLDLVPPGVTEARLWLAGITSPRGTAQPGYILCGAGTT